jgi:1,2-diacylglycerol 3-alpha-glucosyltransferase
VKLRVGVVGACPYPVPQGSQVLLKETARALARRGHDVRLVVYGYGLGEDDSGLPIHRARRIPGEGKTAAGPSWAKPAQDLALAAEVRRVARRDGVQVWLAHNYEALTVCRAARVGPVVYHAHNALADELPHYFGGARWAAAAGMRLDRMLPRRADRVVAPHEALRDYLVAQGCDAKRVAVVPPPVDAEAFETGPVEEALPPVLYTGNLDSYQNLDLLLRAMERVRASVPSAELVLATAEKRAVPGARIVPVSGLAELRAVLARDAVVACPRVSWSGYPMKLLNAMAAGKACVACRGAAYPLEDGVSGRVVADDDPEAFAEALLGLLRDAELRRTLGAAARRVVLERHSLEEIGRRLEAELVRVVAG